MKPRFVSLVLGLLLLTLAGCEQQRSLKITEVAPNRVELFFDGPSDRSLNLSAVNFTWVSQETPGAPSPPAPTRGERDWSLENESIGLPNP